MSNCWRLCSRLLDRGLDLFDSIVREAVSQKVHSAHWIWACSRLWHQRPLDQSWPTRWLPCLNSPFGLRTCLTAAPFANEIKWGIAFDNKEAAAVVYRVWAGLCKLINWRILLAPLHMSSNVLFRLELARETYFARPSVRPTDRNRHSDTHAPLSAPMAGLQTVWLRLAVFLCVLSA